MEFLSDLHPAVVHFPIALICLYIFIELINMFLKERELKKYALIVLLLGIISGIISVLTGNQAYQNLLENPNLTVHHIQLISEHELYATITIWYFALILIINYYLFIKKKNESRMHYLFILFIILGAIILYYTASIGGSLVYDFGIGTDLLK